MPPMLPLPTRRAVLAAGACLSILRFPEARAAAPADRVGAFTVTPLRDGHFPLEPSMIPGADSEAGRALLAQAGLPPSGPSPEPVNAFLIRRGARHGLLDAGCGTVFGPGFDRVTAALAAEGVAARPDRDRMADPPPCGPCGRPAHGRWPRPLRQCRAGASGA
ncbi:exported protein of unknown function [Methylorubrum extorquens]|uniref:Uncharacterized protein n=1 Tax=Methylorubrum extorquens TaxID=408 RepID=A0A2N9APJ2_METEX|nr:exported protein of unknown function [Methylorubrum extorquens]